MLTLVEKVKLSRTDDKYLIEIINILSPMINKYGKKLNNEDGIEEIILHIVKIIKFHFPDTIKYDGQVFNYFKKSIINYYLSELNRNKPYHTIELSEIENIPCKDNETGTDIDFYDLIKILSPAQQKIMTLLYKFSYNETQISSMLNISKQAINSNKCRAIKKIRKQLEEMPP